MPEEDAKKTTDQELQDVSAGAAPQPDTGPEGPEGGGGQGPSWQIDKEPIDAQNIDAGAVRAEDFGSSGPGSGPGSQSIPPYVQTPGGANITEIEQSEASDIAAGGVGNESLGESAPGGSGGTPADPSIKVKVEDADLMSGPDNANA